MGQVGAGRDRMALQVDDADPGILTGEREHFSITANFHNHSASDGDGLMGGKVIVVDVSPQKDLAIDSEFRQTPSAWNLVWNRINPLAKRISIPGVLAIIMRTMLLTSVHNSKLVMKNADLYIRPSVDVFGIFEWRSLDEIVDAGYRHAQKEIAAWKTREAANPAG